MGCLRDEANMKQT